jgi:diguanylate cyclase (GGDEF)-like protein/PAS domain S-box-containing protein
MFEQSSHAHLIFNEDDGIIDCNAAALSMLHCEDKALLIGKPHEMLSPEYQPDGTRSVDAKNKMCERARQSGCETFEWYRKTLDGNIYPAEVTLSPITLDRKSVMLSVWVDLTERKQREQQVRDQTIALEFQKVELEKANAELEALATTDGLTGLQNHRALWERLNEEYERASRHGSSLSLILIDVDHFKLFNDKHGHLAGDVVLRAIGNILRECARETDIMARYGGEEFVVVLPETDLAGATAFADRLRVAVSTHLWSVQPVTASFGVSGLQPGDTSGADIVSRADIALYRSKLAGRNRVYCDGHLKFTNVLEDDTELFENLNEDAA